VKLPARKVRRAFGAHSAPYARRVLGVAALASLVLVAALIAGNGDGTDPAHAATGPCTWTKHTKRVVKRVKRHGKRKKVVRHKAFWTCEPAPTTATATEPPMTMPMPTKPTAPVVEPEPEVEPNALGVAAEDQGGFRYTLSRQAVEAGELVVQLNNRGEDPHTMDMQKVNAEEEPEGPIVAEMSTAPGKQQTETIDVEPGTYRLWCTIGKHAMEGMEATITVE
jgi:plastocyanin